MYPQGGDAKNKYFTEDRTNLTLLVMILGFLALLSIGIMALSIFRQFYPPALSAINKQLNYQGKLQDSTGAVVADGNYNMKFSIYGAPSGGTPLWTECGTTGTPTARTVAVTNGIFSVLLGDTSSGACPGGTNGNAIDLKFDSDSYYLGLTVGADSEMTPRKRIGSAGYSFNSDLLDGLDTSNAGGSNAFVPVTDSSGNLVLTQNLSLGGVFKASNGSVGAPSITFASDTDNGIFLSSGNNWRMVAGGNLLLEMDASGVYVNGSGVIGSGNNITLDLLSFQADGATKVGVIQDTYFPFTTAGAKLFSWRNQTVEKAYIDKDGGAYFGGDVGIGTTGPDAKLDVLSASGSQMRLTYTDGSVYSDFTVDSSGDLIIVPTGEDVFITGNLDVSKHAALATNASYSDKIVLNMDETFSGGPLNVEPNYYYGIYNKVTGQVNPGSCGGGKPHTCSLTYNGQYNELTTNGSYNLNAVTGMANYVNLGGSDQTMNLQGMVSQLMQNSSTGSTNATGIYSVVGEGGYGGTISTAYAGRFSAASGDVNYGIYADALGDYVSSFYSYGVYGVAAGGTAENIGVNGYSSDANSIGVRGNSAGSNGYGVYGYATDMFSQNYGGYFKADGPTGRAVYGWAAGGSGANYGGQFLAQGDGAYGVYAEASDTMGVSPNYGGYFRAYNTGGYGVYGYASGAGTAYGVYGQVGSASGWAGYFTGGGGVYATRLALQDVTVPFTDAIIAGQDTYSETLSSSKDYYGALMSVSSGSDNTTSENFYMYGSYNTAGYNGSDTDAAEALYGVYGQSSMEASGTGTINNSYGVYGDSFVSALSSGTINNSYGVYGKSARYAGTLTNSYGGYFEASGGTNNYAVYGATSGSGNWAGYFTGGDGVYVSQLCLASDGCRTTWPGGSGTPGGSDTNVQFNDGSAFGGDGDFTWDKTNNYLYVAGRVGVGTGAAPFYALDVSTTTTRAASAVTSAVGGYGVYGAATDTSASPNYGGYFTAAGASSSVGIYGEATDNTSVANYGGQFFARGDFGRGVYGEASKTGAVTNYGGQFVAAGDWGYGVYATSSGSSGAGVYGEASASGAVANYGGQFIAYGDWGYGAYGSAPYMGLYGNAGGTAGGSRGVYGVASDTTAYNYGGYFESYGPGGYGVYSSASDTTTSNYGGVFVSSGIGGSRGVWGYANDATAANYGVYGSSASSSGTGVYGDAALYGVRGNSTTGYGVAGFLSGTTGRAVWGSAYNAAGTTTYGGYFNSSGTSGYGVYAEEDAAGTVYGVFGRASNTGAVTNYGGYFDASGTTGVGIYGASLTSGGTTSYGGYFETTSSGTGTSGVYGLANGTATVYGVQGYANNGGAYTNYGGYFRAAGDTGRGVYGEATDTAAVTNYGGYFIARGGGTGAAGVYASAPYATTATSTYGGYFTTAGTGAGTVGVYGESSSTAAVTNYGGNFKAAGTTGRAAYGWASGTTGVNYGGYFWAEGAAAGASGVYGLASGAANTYGVQGVASNTGSYANYGGYFEARGISGARGVYGYASGGSGTNYGVYGQVTSSTGYAGYFTGGYGVYANRANIGRTPSGNDTSYGLVVQGATCIDDGTANCPATPTSGTIYTEGAALQTFDLAELYESAEMLEAGDVVSVDTGSAKKIIKSTVAYQNTTMGVVSTQPGITLGGWGAGPNQYPVALAGRVPVKVNDENGPIAIGDVLTSSSTPGVAMRATMPGQKIGLALEAWSGAGQGVVEVFMASGWDAISAIANDGTAIFFNNDFSFNKLGTADAVTTGYNSRDLTLLGSGWNGSAAEDVAMKFRNTVTDATNYKLSIINNAGAEVAYVGADGSMGVSGKLYPASPTGFQTDAYIFYQNNYMRTNADGWSTGSFDFAEMFLSREALEAGDIVAVDGDTNEYVKKSSGAYDSMVLGIVSTKPGFLAGTNVDFDDPNPDQGYPVALAGRVPTKVSTENGPIVPGDPLTASSVSGVAMKATEPGMVIGVALEGWNNPEVGKIKVFVNLSWYGVNGDLTPVSEMSALTLTGNLDMKGNYILNVAKIVGQDEIWSIDENGILKVKLTNDSTEKEMFGLTSDKVEMSISGTSRLENGVKVIDLSLIDEDFVKNISADTALKIFVTASEECNGVFVSERAAASFTVKETQSGTSGAAFDWMVMARRKGYEDPAPETPVVPPAPPAEPEPTPEIPPAEEPAPSEPAPAEPTPAPETPVTP